MSASPKKIIVAGAGLGGLTLALSLLRQGFEVVVLEQAGRLGEVGALHHGERYGIGGSEGESGEPVDGEEASGGASRQELQEGSSVEHDVPPLR